MQEINKESPSQLGSAQWQQCGGEQIQQEHCSKQILFECVDIHGLFTHYNDFFFLGALSACEVGWSTKMTLCAGTCTRKGPTYCVIRLSQPILKYRSEKQIKETLLHQMIHAYLFLKDPRSSMEDGGHGTAFLELMRNINAITGLHLTVYHNFHAEVNNQRTHVWRCDGQCKAKPPYFGYVRRANNRPPQPADSWFSMHRVQCGGTFIKISAPSANYKSKGKKINNRSSSKDSQSSIGYVNVQKRKKLKIPKKQYKWGTGRTIEDYFKGVVKKS